MEKSKSLKVLKECIDYLNSLSNEEFEKFDEKTNPLKGFCPVCNKDIIDNFLMYGLQPIEFRDGVNICKELYRCLTCNTTFSLYNDILEQTGVYIRPKYTTIKITKVEEEKNEK